MSQTRHDTGVDPNLVRRLLEEDAANRGPYIDAIRTRPTSLGLGFLADNYRRSYLFGSLFDASRPAVTDAIRRAAQVNFTIQYLSQPGNGQQYRFVDDLPIVAEQPLSPEHAHAGNWSEGWKLSVISRQADLVDRLLAARSHIFNQRPIHTPEVTLKWVELYAAVTTDADVAHHPAYLWLREYVATCPPTGSHGKAVRTVSGAKLDLLPLLGRRDADGFEAALGHALKGHQKYWSGTEKRRKDPEGFVALDLVALAVLAWDRGLRFQIESDYLPWAWVDGSAFNADSVGNPSSVSKSRF